MKPLITSLVATPLLIAPSLAGDGSPSTPTQIQFGRLADHAAAGVDAEEPPIIIDPGPGGSLPGARGAARSAPPGSKERDFRVELPPPPPPDGSIPRERDFRVELPPPPPPDGSIPRERDFRVELPPPPPPDGSTPRERDFDVVGADLLRASLAGAETDLQPFREVVAKWQASVHEDVAFVDLDDIEPPIVIDRLARDLWARAVDDVILGTVDEVKAALAAGQPAGAQFGKLRDKLAKRAGILGEDSTPGLRRLEILVTEAEGAAAAGVTALKPFEVEFAKVRTVQAAGIAALRRTPTGLQFSDQVRLAALRAQYRRIHRRGVGSVPGLVID